ncbi:hypothetical protein HY502_03885 [Candidatus Woesebacteria bacterium]|nr:hypothetical protein [Candidatus Woesebacteria bacterium]
MNDGYGPDRKDEFQQHTFEDLKREIADRQKWLEGNHPKKHSKYIHDGHCHACGWLDHDHPENNKKDDAGFTILEYAKMKLEGRKRVFELVKMMTPDDWFDIADFCASSFGHASSMDGIEDLVLGSLLAGASKRVASDPEDLSGLSKEFLDLMAKDKEPDD